MVLGLIGLISGLAAAGSWRTWLLFANRTSFGVQDPQFHLDISFFVFDYPFIRMVLSFLFAAVLLSLVAAAVVHYLYGGLRLQVRGERATQGARAHLFVLVGIFVLLKAVAYWVDRYGIDFSQRGVVQTGASYTDVNAVLPAKTVLAVIAVICAALFFAGAIRRNALLPAVGFGLLVLSAVIIGGVYPAIVQQFVVKPNELAKEGPYLTREINSTRRAYALTHVQVTPYSAVSTEPTAPAGPAGRRAARRAPARPRRGVRVVPAASAGQGVLQVPRRALGRPVPGPGQLRCRRTWSSASATWRARPPARATGSTATWSTRTGSGSWPRRRTRRPAAATRRSPRATSRRPASSTCASPGCTSARGRPATRSSAGTSSSSTIPTQSASGQANTTYRGGGGVPVGSTLNRVLYAIKFRELNILLSGAIDGNSKIMYIRDPLSRVAKVAPFLTLDGNTYPVVVGGQILWVVDAYTTTDNYPYSQRLSLQQASSNSYSPGGSVVGPGNQVNYIRNSVKAVVNAYTGAVTLYQWGGNDPLLDAWKKAFPGVIKPQSAIPADPAAAPALPADPVRGAAADPGPVPRDPGPGVLRRAELLVGAHGPERHLAELLQPAAVLPDDDDARASRSRSSR